MASLHVDGNYFYHLAREMGIEQDFDKLEKALLKRLNLEKFSSKVVYTRPPAGTDPSGIIGWLRAHGWTVRSYRYDHTHQDSVYVDMVSDLWRHHWEDRYEAQVVLSGSGALARPIGDMPHRQDIWLVTTGTSVNGKLAQTINENNKIAFKELMS